MAIAFVAAANNATLTASSLAVNVPAGTAAGHVMVAVITIRTGNSVDNAITAPAGWTLVHAAYDQGSPGVRTGVYWRLAGASEPSSYTWTFASANEPCGSILTYSGVHTTSPVHAQAADVQGTGSTTRTTPTINITVPGCWVVSWFADRSGSTWTGPDVERSEVRVPATSASQVVCDSAAEVPTGTTSRTATASVSTSVAECGIIALAPAEHAASGTGSITGALAMSATGTADAAGAGGITGALTITATGTAETSGTASVAGLLKMSATGTKRTGIGVPPRPRVRWQLIAGPAAGGHELALTAATSRRYTARLTAASELSFSINARNPQAAAIDELRTDVHILWTDDSGQTRILDRCRVGATSDNIDTDSHRMEVSCLDYREVLSRRRLYEGAPLTYTGVDQGEIAWSLVDYTQGLPGGDLGISKGWQGTSPTGVTRDRTYEVRDSIGERVQELSEVNDGFDWDIVPASPSALTFQVWYPQRGADRGVVLEYGGLVAAVRREVNPSEYANAIQYTGSSDPATTPVTVEAADLATRPEGRWDAVFGDDGLVTQATLEDRATWQLSQSEVITPVYTLTLRRGAWRGPDHLWLGDPVRLVIMSGRLRVNTVLRVHELQINIDDDGRETVEVTVGGPKPDYRRRATEFDRRLANLERR